MCVVVSVSGGGGDGGLGTGGCGHEQMDPLCRSRYLSLALEPCVLRDREEGVGEKWDGEGVRSAAAARLV